MSRASRRIGLVAGFLLSLCAFLALNAQTRPRHREEELLILLPEHFVGWACIDFGVPEASPLPREGDSLVIRPRPGEILKTSDKPKELDYFTKREIRIETKGGQRHLPQGEFGEMRVQVDRDTNPFQRFCAFYGTVDEADAASNAPGFENRSYGQEHMSAEEREALIDLYNATDGDHWKHHVGWLGAPGTECKWHGVYCGRRYFEPEQVTGLYLSDNHLVGTLPRSFSNLSHLFELRLSGDQVSGVLPRWMIDKWVAGTSTFRLSAETPLLTDITKIEFQSDGAGLPSGAWNISIESDGRVQIRSQRFDKLSHGNESGCKKIVKDGRISARVFVKLAWLIESNGFFDLHPIYERYEPHNEPLSNEVTRVTRNASVKEVLNFADGGPFQLWVIQRGIEGVLPSVMWGKTTTLPKCLGWEQ